MSSINGTKTDPVSLEEAVRVLQSHLKEYPDLYEGYKANIAMSFKDEYEDELRIYPDEQGVKSQILHKIANNAADRFLKLFIG